MAGNEIHRLIVPADEFAVLVKDLEHGLEVGCGHYVVHTVDDMVRIVVDELIGGVGLLGAVVTGGGGQVPVVELPVKGRPGAVEHPLDNAGGVVDMAAEGLEHGAGAVVIGRLGLADEVLETGGFAVFSGHYAQHAAGVHLLAPHAVLVPHFVHGP